MVKQLKTILMDIAKLPVSDQHWILKHLPDDTRSTFMRLNGSHYLKEARRFKSLTIQPSQAGKKPIELPAECMTLANEDPLYIAIVLEEATPIWINDFLTMYDKSGMIRAFLQQDIFSIKPLAKQAVLTNWQQRGSFAYLLENEHG